MQPVVFLDRDGTINEEKIYLSSPDDLRLIPGAAQAIKRLNQAGWAVVLITNQSGIGRGYFSLETLEAIHQRLEDELAEVGAHLDGVYVCPHCPDDGCACRKPATLLFEQAIRDLDLDPHQAVAIGDKASDLEPGHRLGYRTILVLTGHGQTQWTQRELWNFAPDVVVADLEAAVEHILT